jgi:hypothetical protein
LYGGSGTPAGIVSAGAGSLYVSTAGDLYRKTGTGSTGWKLVAGSGPLEVQDLQVYDDTPTTGVTSCVAKAGAGQGTDAILEVQNGAGTPKFSVDQYGRVFGKGAVDISNNGTGDILIVRNSAGTQVFSVWNNGTIATMGDLHVGGYVANLGNVVGANGAVVSKANGDLEGVFGSTIASQSVVTSAAAGSSSGAIPAAIDTTGMTGDTLTVANKVNAIISALGAGDTVIKSLSVSTKGLSTDRGIVTGLA